ncbi:hypothetical protein V6C53_17830 [Desulfocurvibacter africanus]|uniref:hypothetical protein n=1 Tax=Desulfocurvibacter africanus TaxID=873 RepID=UPI002FDA9DFE
MSPMDVSLQIFTKQIRWLRFAVAFPWAAASKASNMALAQHGGHNEWMRLTASDLAGTSGTNQSYNFEQVETHD